MKPDIVTMLNSYIADNEMNISEFSAEGYVSDYLWHELLTLDRRYYWYLTEDEIKEFDTKDLSAWKHAMSIHNLIQKYDMPVERFMLLRSIGLYK